MFQISDIIDQDEFATSCSEQLSPVLEGLTETTEVFVRLNFSLGQPLSCLKKERSFPKSYFKARDSSKILAAAGAIKQFSSDDAEAVSSETNAGAFTLSKAEQYLEQHPQGESLKLFGGLGFSGLRDAQKNVSESAEEWRGFPETYFFLAEIVFEESVDGNSVTVGVKAKPGDSLSKIIGRVQRRLYKYQGSSNAEKDTVTELKEQPNSFEKACDASAKDSWRKGFKAAIKGFESNIFEKVVLAKRKEFALETGLEVYAILEGMLEDRRSYSFCFWPTESKFFLSRSPERLFKHLGTEIEIDALGGTVPRGDTVDQNEVPIVGLDSDKVKREHQLVIDDLLAKLANLKARGVEVAETTKIDLLHVSHLCTGIKARLDEATSAKTLETLHPTAAICGFPDKTAYEFIVEHEPFNRGWYAGAVGVLEQGSSEFIVALRCVLSDAKKAYLYAGAGLVAGSDVEAEWLETEAKLASLEKTIVKYGL